MSSETRLRSKKFRDMSHGSKSGQDRKYFNRKRNVRSAARVRARLTKCIGSTIGAGGTRSTTAPRLRRREDFSVAWSEGMQLRDVLGWEGQILIAKVGEQPTCTLDSLLLCKLSLAIFQWILRCLRR